MLMSKPHIPLEYPVHGLTCEPLGWIPLPPIVLTKEIPLATLKISSKYGRIGIRSILAFAQPIEVTGNTKDLNQGSE